MRTLKFSLLSLLLCVTLIVPASAAPGRVPGVLSGPLTEFPTKGAGGGAAGPQPAPAQGTGTTTRVSVASDGTQGNGNSVWSSISADGRYVASESSASNLVPNDTNGTYDIFVYDRATGQITCVSVASDGTQANGGGSYSVAISADGRYVAFESLASNLVSTDTNNYRDVFVHDRQTGQTERVSVASDGTEANDKSFDPSISANGRYVAFKSRASNLVHGDTNGSDDVFVHDRQTGQTERVSVASDGTEGNARVIWGPSISADGRYVAFASYANNLVSNDTNGHFDVFVHDKETGDTRLVSVASDETQGNSSSILPSISADGRYVAFKSYANNLVPNDTNNCFDVFVHDRQTGQTERVSVASDGTEVECGPYEPAWPISISADGRYVAFYSSGSNLVPHDTNNYCRECGWGSPGTYNCLDVFVHDCQSGETTRVSVASDGMEGNNGSAGPAISGDGRYVVFWSLATNLVVGDTNSRYDVFVHDRGGEPGPTPTPSPTLTPTPSPSGKPWLLMYYLAGDNDKRMHKAHEWFLSVLKGKTGQPEFNIAVMYDGLAEGDSRYYYIADNVTFVVKNEVNTGDPNTLVEFVNWARDQFACPHSALIIDDHGNVDGAAVDVSSSTFFFTDYLTMPDLKSAYGQIVGHGGKVDVLVMDACLMGTIESAYQARDFADYYVASEQISWGPNAPYYLNQIALDSSAESVATSIALSYERNRNERPAPYTISVARMSRLPDLAEKVSTFAEMIKLNTSIMQLIKLEIELPVQRFDSDGSYRMNVLDELIDLYDFARLIREKSDDAQMQAAAEAVMDAIEDDPVSSNHYIIYKEHWSGNVPEHVDAGTPYWDLEHSHGVSGFFPSSSRSFYNQVNFDFAAGTDWSRVLEADRLPAQEAETIEWGPMLVEYVRFTNPEEPDDPNPPPLLAPLSTLRVVYLPLVLSSYGGS